VILTIWYSSDEPIGFLIGSLIKSDDSWSTMIFLSIVCGIFLYVSCSDILMEVLENNKHTIIKVISFLLGIIFIIGVSFIPGEHEHGAEEEEHHDH